MASSVPNCDICTSQQKSVQAEVLCLECDESLCTECRKHHTMAKVTSNHNTIPINEYFNLSDYIINIKQVCKKHNERFIVYCHDHTVPGCSMCVLEVHRVCQNVKKIEHLVGNIKSSSAFSEIEETLSDMSNNIDNLQSDRLKNLKYLHEQKLLIEKNISALRAEINAHLDTIQSQIICDLFEKEKRERDKIELSLKSLSVQHHEIKQLKHDFLVVKKHASDLHTFLVLGEIEKRINVACKTFLNMTAAGEFDYAKLKHQEQKHTSVSDLNSVNFGKIGIEISPSTIKLMKRKGKQAQLPVLPLYPVESVSIRPNRSINTGCRDTCGCVTLPDGRSIFTCYDEHVITCFYKGGNRHHIMKKLKPSYAFDIAYSDEMNTIFISSGAMTNGKLLEINLDDGNMKPIESDSYNYGLVLKSNKIIYCAKGKGLCERNISNGSERVIVSDHSLPWYCYVAEYRDQLYYTNSEDHSVTCCRMDGILIWRFTNDALKCPLGVSVDNFGNVFVVGGDSTNVVLISADGQQCKEILSKKDGLVYPQVLYFHRSTNQLLVANAKDKAFLFDVIYP